MIAKANEVNKKRRMKIIIAIFLLALLFFIYSMNNEVRAATETETLNGVTATLTDDGTMTISGSGEITQDLIKKFDYKSIKKATINSGITSIGDSAFYRCSSLTSVTIPEGLTIIGRYAFDECSSLISIKIPEGVTSIGSFAFRGCNSLSSINVDSKNPYYCSIEGNLFNKEKTEIKRYLPGKTSTSYIIPSGVTSIGNGAFEGCSSLTSIKIPEGVTSIGILAFDKCSSLTSIEIPEGVTSIEWSTFCDCSSLISIKIPKGLTSIEWQAFYGCSSLTSIEIPEGVTSIGIDTFRGCSSLTSVKIPEGVTSIKSYAFCACSSLTSIIIPTSVTSIDSYAFCACSSLTSIIIPTSVTSIEKDVFVNCENLTIYCKSKTTAETYAKENNIKYIIDDNGPEVDVTGIPTNWVKEAILTITATDGQSGLDSVTVRGEKIALTNGKGTYKVSKKGAYNIVAIDNLGNKTIEIVTVDKIGVLGDVNGDGVVGLVDVLKVRRYISNSTKWSLTDEEKTKADVNKDGKINLTDVLKLRRYIAASENSNIAAKHPDWLEL